MMAESSAPDTTGGGSQNKIMRFIRKNKTLSAVLGLGGGYFLWKQMQASGGGEVGEEVEGAYPASYEGPIPATGELSQEGVNEEINRIDEERRNEREEQDEREREKEREEETGGESAAEGGSGEGSISEEPEPAPAPEAVGSVAQGGLSIQGKTFPGATSYRIANTGTTDGGKKYVEYVISFPGRQEHWQRFTATGNWRKVNDSSQGPGANKPIDTKNGGGGSGGAPNGGTSIPSNDPANPKAVNTGNKCVNGGVGGHTAPRGYHLYCKNGYIWRAPDQVSVAPAKPVGGSPAPAAASCPQEFRDAASKHRANIQRLQNEIDGLQRHIGQLTDAIQAHPNANKRGQWESERNQDRSNIDHKRNEIGQSQNHIDVLRRTPGCGNV